MQSIALEFATEEECREMAKKLWDGYGVSGEMVIRELPGGKWRIDLTPEKDIKENTLEKFAAFRVEAGD